MRKTRRTVTIQDVAKTAGVSVSTVSRVLNGKVDVASETQDRIRSVIDDLGYTTNLAARSMRSFKKNMVGLIMPDIAYPFAIEAFSTDAPIVSIDPLMSDPNYPSVHATNYQGATDAMNYLLGLGHTRIGFISGRAELESSNRRLKGYRDAIEKAGLPIDEKLIASGDYTTETGAKCAHELLTGDNPPSAIFASNDQAAMGVFQVAHEMGIRIPEDLSVIGFDNIMESKYMRLTTVDQFISEMGFVATQMLIKLINGETLDSQTYKMQTQLVIRNSCQEFIGNE